MSRPKPHPSHGPKKEPPKPGVPNWLVYFLIIVITLAWVTAFIVGLFNPKYQTPEQVNLIFSSIVGGLFLNAATRRKGNDDE